MKTDPYRILGVERSATLEQIKSAYRKLAREHHPDRRPDDKAAENRFKDISSAYALLSDPAKRRKFDAGEIDGHGNPRPGFGAKADASAYETYKRNASNGKNTGGGFGFGAHANKGGNEKKSRFNTFFRDKSSIKAKGADVSYTLKVSLIEAALGADKTVRMTTGKSLKVHIPPGTQNGQVLRLKHQGMDGLGGGETGDALVEILVLQDATFRADGLDIHADAPVTVGEAMLGGRIEVQTIHGPVLVTVPEGSNSGVKLRLKGKGMSGADGQKGDHYVTLKVVLPPKGTAAEVELKAFVRKWAAKRPYSVRQETLKGAAAAE